MKNLLTLIVITISVFNISPSYAVKMKPISLQNLAAQSDVIALVEIEESRQIKTVTTSCGVEHKTTVHQVIKGDINGSVNFGYMSGLKTGKKYLVFLNKNSAKNKAVIFTSTNFQKQFSNKATLSECEKVQLAEYTLSQAGTAYFDIEPFESFEYKQSAKISTQYFRVGESLKHVADKHEPNSIWVEFDSLVKVFKAD